MIVVDPSMLQIAPGVRALGRVIGLPKFSQDRRSQHLTYR
ncbi:hypothetical protein MMMB2_0172 [Mycobacterium marinum MB2]|nr:hypothetical protein MMMB2_0172 [Mycobacterium marinum MB2]